MFLAERPREKADLLLLDFGPTRTGRKKGGRDEGTHSAAAAAIELATHIAIQQYCLPASIAARG